MSTTLREQGIETVHDQVVSLVAQRWAKAFHCRVTIHTGLEHNPWADPQQQTDIVGWFVTAGGNTMEWMAEVETEDSLLDPQTVDHWKKSAVRGVPFYLLVPKGLKEQAGKLAHESDMLFNGIYEYLFVNGVCHVI